MKAIIKSLLTFLCASCAYAGEEIKYKEFIDDSINGIPSFSATWIVTRKIGQNPESASQMAKNLQGTVSEERLKEIVSKITNGYEVRFEVGFNYVSRKYYSIKRTPIKGELELLEWYSNDEVFYATRRSGRIVTLSDSSKHNLKEELGIGIPIFFAERFLPLVSTTTTRKDKRGHKEGELLFHSRQHANTSLKLVLDEDGLMVQDLFFSRPGKQKIEYRTGELERHNSINVPKKIQVKWERFDEERKDYQIDKSETWTLKSFITPISNAASARVKFRPKKGCKFYIEMENYVERQLNAEEKEELLEKLGGYTE